MNPRKTAFLVIQGVSSQKPLTVLDSFTRGIVSTLHSKSTSGGPITLSNRLTNFEGRPDSFVRIDAGGAQTVDVYEYYWADRVPGKATLADVIDWLLAVSDGAKEFYENRLDLVAVCQRPLIAAFRNNIMEANWYLSRIGGLFRVLALIDQVFPTSQWIRLSGLLKLGVMPLLGFVHKQIAGKLVEFLGDAALYTRADGSKASFNARAEVLDGALRKLNAILQSDEEYDQVLVAGHSLGSVIAYDTINRLIQRINALPESAQPPAAYRRLKGLITFGSPLDKVAFQFRFRSRANDYVRRQLIGQRHGFRAKDVDVSNYRRDDMRLESPYHIGLDEQIQWINYWDAKDLVSGHLDFYTVDENVQCEMSGSRVDTHVHYWDYMPMYLDIARRFMSLSDAN